MQFDIPANSNNSLKNSSLPFVIEKSGIRGHFVRLNEEVHSILSNHKYPLSVSQLLGELLVLVSIIGSMLKLKGMISIQAQGDGAIGSITADYTSEGNIRGYAHINDRKFMQKIDVKSRKDHDISNIFGKGAFIITIENNNERPYQAIVPLEGKSLTESIIRYLRESNQVDAIIEVATNKINKKWHAGGIVLQRDPQSPDHIEEDWNRAATLLETATDRELIDANLPMPTLLYRLFHEEGVRIFEAGKIKAQCRCSRQRMANALQSLTPDELEEMKVKDVITMTCHFCSNKEDFCDGDY